MTLIELLIWSPVMLVCGFLIGFLSVYFYIAKIRKKQKTYQFSELDSFDFKKGIDTEMLSPPNGSDIDGVKAVDQFKIQEKKSE